MEFSSVTASSYDADSLVPLLNEKAAEGWEVASIVSAGTNIVAYLQRRTPGDGAAGDVADEQAIAEAMVVEAVAEQAIADAVTQEAVAEQAIAEAIVVEAVAEGAIADAIVDEAVAEEVIADAMLDEALAEEAIADAMVTEAETAAAVDEPAGWAAAPEDDKTGDAAATAAAAAAVAAAAPAAEQPPTAPAAAEPAAAQPAPAQPAPAEPAPAEQTTVVKPEAAVPAGWYADPSGRFELRYWDASAWTEHVSRAGQQFTDPPVA